MCLRFRVTPREVEAVTDNETVLDCEAEEVDLHSDPPPRRLVQQAGRPSARGLRVRNMS